MAGRLASATSIEGTRVALVGTPRARQEDRMHMARLALLVLTFMLHTRLAAAVDGTCVAACGATAEEAGRNCLANHGIECGAVAQAALQQCIAACPAPPTDCSARCEAGATEIQSHCLSECTGDNCANLCQQAHDTARDRCVSEFCGDGPPTCIGDTRSCCLEDCNGVARGVFTTCMIAGGDAARLTR